MGALSQHEVGVVEGLLQRRYGRPRPARVRPLLDVLIETVLSQNTSDRNSHRAYANLRRRFSRWEGVLRSPVDQVAGAIKAGGLANIKAQRIKDLVAEFTRRNGRPGSGFLSRMAPEDAYRYLMSLKGVGPKTAACTLLFARGTPIFPVDTHIFRISRRLGWAWPRDGRASFQERIRQIVPGELVLPLHLNMIAHGRAVCHPGRPDCPACPLQRHCNWHQRRERP